MNTNQYKLLALPDALLLIPSLNTPYIRIIGFNGLSWYILNPGIWTRIILNPITISDKKPIHTHKNTKYKTKNYFIPSNTLVP